MKYIYRERESQLCKRTCGWIGPVVTTAPWNHFDLSLISFQSVDVLAAVSENKCFDFRRNRVFINHPGQWNRDYAFPPLCVCSAEKSWKDVADSLEISVWTCIRENKVPRGGPAPHQSQLFPSLSVLKDAAQSVGLRVPGLRRWIKAEAGISLEGEKWNLIENIQSVTLDLNLGFRWKVQFEAAFLFWSDTNIHTVGTHTIAVFFLRSRKRVMSPYDNHALCSGTSCGLKYI